MKLSFKRAASAPTRQPLPAEAPRLKTAELAAAYEPSRIGGDYFDFASAGASRVLLLLLDIAGYKDEALPVAAALQERFRQQAPELFQGDGRNLAEAVAELYIDLNRALMTAVDGVHCAPGFLACFDEEMGMLSYINAGHPPALLRDGGGIALLESGGLPMGLFTHAAHEAQVQVMQPGAALLVASRGVIESGRKSNEFGVPRLQQALAAQQPGSARELCRSILEAAQAHARGRDLRNDASVVALVRTAGPQLL